MAGSGKHFTLVGNREDRHHLHSLQDLCRTKILNCFTLRRVQQVTKLPLPSVIKQYLLTFRIPMDFDLDGIYMDYNSNFPNHVHHQTHQIHPGKCMFDGSKILLRTQHLYDPCKICQSTGHRTMLHQNEREKWVWLRHDNLMNCHFSMYNPQSQMMSYVFDFPIINLEDFAVRMHVFNKRIPEHLVWEVLLKLTDVLSYLEQNGIYPWELCHPQHVVIGEKGNIKLEHMLLYLPLKSGAHFNTGSSNALSAYTSPEQLRGGQLKGPQTLIWGLGCILRELTAHIPSALLSKLETHYKNFPPIIAAPSITGGRSNSHHMSKCCTGDRYSVSLQNTIADCLLPSSKKSPTLKKLRNRAKVSLKKSSKPDWTADGAKSFLDLLRECDEI